MLISIDHGNYAIKTLDDCFIAGLSEYSVKPPLAEHVIEHEGRFWTLTGSRLAYMRDKAKDDKYFIHSDRGSQYCSHDYQKELKKDGFICSMSRKANCWDNAPMESFWGKLKQEWLNDKRFRTREDAKQAIFWYIEVYYENYRLHETNGYMTPNDYTTAT
jgi:putative transposase